MPCGWRWPEDHIGSRDLAHRALPWGHQVTQRFKGTELLESEIWAQSSGQSRLSCNPGEAQAQLWILPYVVSPPTSSRHCLASGAEF